ncbi:E3 ubiquitin-protein ligase NRDP1-like [Teleopsis dalmanni]|uniref:E3 ubiquitin-protein ligase NRDP1-like n=1 Tax=Teleopsis dalmanni TaxID=139649 RepID=UPI0018CD18BC|nr:E3 ubiquitin-protein ligase NRDP1-like [Teleopsis dalmanni]
MGLNIDNFLEDQSKVERFECPVCLDGYENPSTIKVCGHTFCKACILEWRERHSSCPMCRSSFGLGDLKNFRGKLYNTYLNFKLKCDNEGCMTIITVGGRKAHLKRCAYKPKPED